MALLIVEVSLWTAAAAVQSSLLILFILPAAFDTVNHQILLSIVSELGISNAALDSSLTTN